MAEVKDGVLLLEDIHETKDEKKPEKKSLLNFIRKAAWQ